mgnify:CR=1 FL=1
MVAVGRDIDDVIEASGKLPVEALQAALADTRHGFNMSRTNLVKLDDAGVPYQMESGTSIYFRDPDGARMELIADPLGEMYGSKVM